MYKQSAINTLILFIGFAIGGINVLFLYTHFLAEDYYGLITFLLSTATIFLPFLIFGMHNTVIKFYSSYKTKEEKDAFLTTSLFLPLLVVLPSTIIGVFFYEQISNWLSSTNPLIKNYTYLIFLVALFMGYFELFYAWSKVQLQSVFGNFIKEVFARLVTSILLVLVYLKILSNEQFIFAVVITYGVRMLIMFFYALYLYQPQLIIRKLANLKEIIHYSYYIILAGSAGFILLEIDKFMIPQIQEGLEKVAFYSVGIYIASVVGIPARAMQQIATPITAKAINNNKFEEVKDIYKSSSVNQLLAGGLLFLLINLNVVDLYAIIGKPEYATGVLIVLMISIAKLVELAMGTNIAILSNSKFYSVYFYLSLAMAISVIVLNKWLITLFGNNGAALSTLIVVVVFVVIRILYVKRKLKMQPFSKKTMFVLLEILFFYGIFYFIPLDFNPFVNIFIRVIFISLMYLSLSYYLKISSEYMDLVKKYFNL